MLDKNGKEIKTGDLVKIDGAYFKNDNGTYRVMHSPGDENWLGSDYSLQKAKKDGTLSQAKYSLCFWPIVTFVSDRSKLIAAREHNKANATIEIISA